MTDSVAFTPAFSRYTAKTAHELTRISAALARIEASDIRPAAEDELRASAKAETVHYSTLIEGNELPMIEAQRATKGELKPEIKAKIELINYVAALDLLDQRVEETGLAITSEFILKIHEATTLGLGSEASEHFKPHHEGAWRDGVAAVVDRRTNEVLHEGSKPEEVEGRMTGLCEWIASKEQNLVDVPAPVIAGVAHYAVTDIHPFADGNGRVARLTAAALLMRHGFLPGRLFSFERYYAEDREAYYAALRSVRANTLNMNEWLEYFLAGLASEYERVADKITELENLGLRSDQPFQLSDAQERAVTQLNLAGLDEFRRVDYENVAGVPKYQANRDLARLEEAGLVSRRGRAVAARYRFRSRPWEERRGRPRVWTAERIESELRDFCAGRTTFPAVADFRAADRMALYNAASRYGGLDRWASRLELRRR